MRAPLSTITFIFVCCLLTTMQARGEEVSKSCDAKYDTTHDNFCLHNPSKCADSKWKSISASCRANAKKDTDEAMYEREARGRAAEGLCSRNPAEFGPCPKNKRRQK